MEKQIKWLVFLVAISLVFHLYSIVKMNGLTQHVHSLNQQYASLEQSLDYRFSYLERELYELRQGERWLVDIHFQANQQKSVPGDIWIDAQWTFKELETDADVTFLFRKEQEDVWKEVDAQFVSGTTYEAPLQLDPESQYMYRIASTGTLNRGTEEEYLPAHLYQPSPPNISTSHSSGGPNNEVFFEATLHQYEVLFDFYQIKEATAIVHFSDGSTKKIPFVNEPYDNELVAIEDNAQVEATTWYVRVQAEEVVSIEVEVTYGDGSKQRDEMYLFP